MDTSQTLTSKTFIPEERQQVLYAALLRYTSEAKHLRDKGLDYIVRTALIGTNEDNTYRIGAIQKQLWIGDDSPQFRIEIIQETLTRLIIDGKVRRVQVNRHNTYHLISGQNEDLNQVYESSKDMFNKVLRRMLKGTENVILQDQAIDIFRTFIFECFSRFGRQIAKMVTGEWSSDDLLREMDIEKAFSAAIKDKDVSSAAFDSLRSRCLNFIRSKDIEAENLKFHLTQGYYFIELFGLDKGQFFPLTEDAFSGAVFYLDTNVIIPRLLASPQEGSLFDEMLRFARRVGINLCVTRATMNEARTVASRQVIQLKEVLSSFNIDILEEISLRTKDHFLTAFFSRREHTPLITPEDLVAPFDRIREVLQDEIGLTIIEKTPDEILGGRDYPEIAAVMQQASEETRGHLKSENILNHDISHYVLVEEERKINTKTWFLTRDRSLLEVSKKLAAEGNPFCFSLIAFLQSLSPFLTSPAEEKTVVEVFSDFITEQVFPQGPIFEIRDLKIFGEYQEDIITTHPDDVIEALDFVKGIVLKGKPYKLSDVDKVSTELKKYLASSGEERIQNLMVEAERLSKDAEKARTDTQSERKIRKATETELINWKEQSNHLNALVQTLVSKNKNNTKQIEQLTAQVNLQQDTLRENRYKAEQARRRNLMFLGFFIGISYWIFNDWMIVKLLQKWDGLLEWQNYLRMTERVH